MARPTLTLDNVPLLMPYMLSDATSNYKQGVGVQPFALHQNIKHCLLPKQKHFMINCRIFAFIICIQMNICRRRIVVIPYILHDASFQDDLRTALKRAQSQRDDHLQQRTPRGADNRRRRRQENLYNHCKPRRENANRRRAMKTIHV